MKDRKKGAKTNELPQVSTIPTPVEMEDPAPEPVPEAPYPQWDDIPEYHQPEISPYTTKPITITIGDFSYAVPEYFLRPYPAFEVNQWTRIFNLSDIHEDVGHTFIHYLYTNTYETTKRFQEDADRRPRAREFHRSMHTYHAARRYGITGLIDLAKTYIRVFDIDVSTLYILSVAREISTTLPHDEVWFWEYIREKLAIAFEEDEAGLRQDIASYGVGRDPFDAFLVTSVLDIYASALPGKAPNGHVETATQSEADVSEEGNTVEEAYEWDSDPGEEPVVKEPHAIDGPLPESPGRYVEGEAVPELEPARSPEPVAMSPSPPPPEPTSPPAPPADDYDPWDSWGVRGRINGAYTGPATGVPARLTTLVEEQSETAAEAVPVEDKKPVDDWDLGFSTSSKKKKKRGRYYDIAPAQEHPEPVIQEPPLELEPEPEPEPGIPLPEPAVPERTAPPAESPAGNGWVGFQNQDFRFYSPAQPVATAE